MQDLMRTVKTIGTDELVAVQGHFACLSGDLTVLWHSPRPFSAVIRVCNAHGDWFIKRLDARVRSADQIQTESHLRRHLSEKGVAVPDAQSILTHQGARAAMTTCHGQTEAVYEVLSPAPGVDKYAHLDCWRAPDSPGELHGLGQALARWHLGAASFDQPARPVQYLLQGMNLLGHDLARSAWHDYVAHFPGLQRYLAARPSEELEQVLQSVCRWHAPVRSILRDLPTQWVHNDAHVSNLTWTSASAGAQPAAWLDLGGSNRGWAVGDLAIALERNTISWLEPAPRLDLTMAKALINGYQEARPLSLPERQVLPNLLVLCQVEFALSEIAYFLEVCQDAAGADLAWTGFVRDRLTWFVTPDGNDALAQLRASLLQETPRS